MIKVFTKNNTLLALLSLAIGSFFAFKYIGVQLENPYSVQDDFRQSFFWVWQYFDNTLLPNDFFAEMYKSHIVRLPILNLIFHLVARFNIDLLVFSKYFSIVVGIASSFVAYLFISTISKNRSLNILFTIFISFVFYCTDHISAAQARSFIWIGLMLYLFFKNSNRPFLSTLTCFILLFISPNTFLLCLGMEAYAWLIAVIKEKKLVLKSISFFSPILNALSALILYKVIFKDIQTQGVGTPFTKFELKTLPEFNPGGRHPIFGSHFWDGTWFRNEHWGFGYGYLEISKLVFIGIAAVVVYFVLRSLLKSYDEKLNSLALLSLSSLSLYFASQLLFPLLYLPSRYIAAPTLLLAVVFTFLALEKIVAFFLDNLIEILKIPKENIGKLSCIGLIILSVAFCSYFFVNDKKYIHLRYVSMNKGMVQRLNAISKDSLVAGYPILPDLNAASIITKRKVYVDYERSMAYTRQSLMEIRRRNKIAIEMTFAQTKEEFLTLARQEKITHFFALMDLYSPLYLRKANYLKPYNKFLHEKIAKSQNRFYLKSLLMERKERYALLDISTL